jgi:hypothetical protein
MNRDDRADVIGSVSVRTARSETEYAAENASVDMVLSIG